MYLRAARLPLSRRTQGFGWSATVPLLEPCKTQDTESYIKVMGLIGNA